MNDKAMLPRVTTITTITLFLIIRTTKVMWSGRHNFIQYISMCQTAEQLAHTFSQYSDNTSSHSNNTPQYTISFTQYHPSSCYTSWHHLCINWHTQSPCCHDLSTRKWVAGTSSNTISMPIYRPIPCHLHISILVHIPWQHLHVHTQYTLLTC